MIEMGKNQKECVKNHLLKFGWITSWDAIRFYGITRLSQYIYLLEKDGYMFKKENKKNVNNSGWHTVYTLVDEGE